jgi:hypothetical protein
MTYNKGKSIVVLNNLLSTVERGAVKESKMHIGLRMPTAA